MSSLSFPPGLDALGRLFNAITGEYAKVSQTYAVSGLQSTSDTRQVIPEYDSKLTFDIPRSVNFDDFQANAVGTMQTGSSISSYQSKLAVAAQIGAKYGAYSGSISGSWSNAVTTTDEEYFATAFDSWSLYTLGFSPHDVDLTTTEPENARTGLCISPELKSGFDQLQTDTTGANAIRFFNQYGTHVVAGMVVGGQTRQDYQGSQSSFSSEQDFQVSAEAKYDVGVGSAAFGTTTSGANTKHESSVQTYESMTVFGGSVASIDALKDNPSSAAYDAWSETIPAFPAFIDYTPDQGTVPVWMFCTDTAKRGYLQSVFHQLYGETPLSTYGATVIDCRNGNLEWIDPPGSPVRSWSAGNPDEVLVGIGGSISDGKHLERMVVVSYSLSRDEYSVHYIGGGNADSSWEAFYMAPKGYVITGFGVARKSTNFEHLYVWYQKLNRQNLDGSFLDDEVHSWMGGSSSSSRKIDPKALPVQGDGWCHGGTAAVSDLQRYIQPTAGQQHVITGVQLYSSDEHGGFANMKITQSGLRVETE